MSTLEMASLIAKSQSLTSFSRRPWSKKLFSAIAGRQQRTLLVVDCTKNADHFVGRKASEVDEESKQGLINETASGCGVKFIRYEIREKESNIKALKGNKEPEILAERRENESNIKASKGNKKSEILAERREKESNIKVSEGNKESEILAERRTRSFTFDEKDLESKETLWRLYEKWQRYHNVTRDVDKNHEKFDAFMKNAKFVHEFNKRTDVTFKVSLNRFGDATDKEYRRTLGTRTTPYGYGYYGYRY